MAIEDQDFVMLDVSDVQGFNEEGILPLPAEKLSIIQTWLAPTDYKATGSEYRKHCASHLSTTGTWVFQTDQYQQWHDLDRGALWIKAIAGAGKSVIAASVTSKLATEEQVPVLYFFFRHIISANQKPQSLVRDYLSQLLEHSPELQHNLNKLVDDRRSLDSMSFDELWNILVSALVRFPRVYCIADALDEMDVGNEFFLHNLVELGSKNPTSIKLMITSRPVPRVEQVLRHPSVLQIVLEPQFVYPDISVYVRHRVSNCDASERVRSQIHEAMCARADGHFLYARLMMDDLLEPSKNLLSSEKELLFALNTLPTPMADMYTKMLLDHSRRSAVPQQLQLTLLQWVTGSERPLRLLELSSMVEFKKSALGMSKETKSIVREGCGPLLEILEDETICPIHHSFNEYLYDLDRQYDSSEIENFPVLESKEVQRAIAITCIRYLASDWHRSWKNADELNQSLDYERRAGAMKMKYPFLDYAANNWHHHVRKSGANDVTMASELDVFLLKDPEIIPVLLKLTTKRDPFSGAGENQLFKTWGALHVAAANGLNFYAEYLIENGHDFEYLDLEAHTPLAVAARNGHDEVVAVLLKKGAQNDGDDNIGLKPLHHAATRNHYETVRLLLEAGVDPFTPKTKENPGRMCGNARSSVGDTAVEYACQNGHVETIKAFIPFLKGHGLQQALSWAIKNSQTTIAMALLKVPGIDVNCTHGDQTPLYLASSVRDVELMRMLLDMGADAHILSMNSLHGRFHCIGELARNLTPLQAFAKSEGRMARNRDWDVTLMNNGFGMLLDAGLDINAVDRVGYTILHDILSSNNRTSCPESKRGVEHTLSLLLDRGLSAITLTPDGSNALHRASGISTTVINILTSRGVDINYLRIKDGKTPLIAALERQDLETAQNLLDCGADANFADAEGNTALHFLAKMPNYKSNLDMIKALITAGADVNERNKDGNTPMHLGLSSLSPELLSTFLEHGFDIEAKNKSGQTILFLAISQWRTGEPHKVLVDAGASPFTRDLEGSTILHAILLNIQEIGVKTTDLIRYFVQKGVDPLVIDNSGNTLWHAVARLGAHYHQKEQLAVMNLLVEYGIPLMAKNHAGKTPLNVAFSVNRNHYPYGSIEFLLEHAVVDINGADYDKIRPIHLTSSSDPSLTCFLLELGADPTLMTIEGQTSLMIACRTRQCNIVCILLDYYKNHNQLSLIDQVDNKGRSALHYACKSGRPEVVALLLNAGANANLQDKTGFTPLHICAEYLDEQATWDRAKPRFENWQPHWIKAAYVLLTDQSRPNGSDVSPDPVRIRETIRLLVANGADISFLTTNKKPHLWGSNNDPLSYSIQKGCEAVVSELLIIQDKLLQAKLLSFRQNTTGLDGPRNEIEETIDEIKKSWSRALNDPVNRVRFLKMYHMPEIMTDNIKPGQNNIRLIQQVLKEDDEPSVEEASRLGAQFLELENGGENPIYQMVSWGFTDLIRSVGQDAAKINTAWINEKAPLNVNWGNRLKNILYTALERPIPNLEMVKLLVNEFKLDLNERLGDGTYFVHILATPLHWWQTEALKFLLENGANVEVRALNQDTPLIAALRLPYGNTYRPVQVRTVETLLLNGADPNAIDKDGLTCLNIAAGQPRCVKLLLKYGANPSLGFRPFIFDAIKEQDLDTLRIIVESGTNVHVLAQPGPESEINEINDPETDEDNTEGRVALDHLRGEGTLQAWPKIFSVDDLCKCAYPIHVAASQFFTDPGKQENATKIVNLLLGAGEDPCLFYRDGASMMHLLAEQSTILEPFFQHPSFDSESRDHRGRTILLAACNAHYGGYHPHVNATLIPRLIKHGASITAVDHDGCNALHSLISALSPGYKSDSWHSAFMSASKPFMPMMVSKPNLQGRTPFHYVISGSHFDLIDHFLSHGADPLIPDPLDGSTALHRLAAGLSDHMDMLLHDPGLVLSAEEKFKLSKKPDSDHLVDGDLLEIVHAKFFVHESLARAQLCSPRRHFASLLSRGLSIESCDNAGETPLFKLMTAELYNHHSNHGKIFPALKVFETAGANFKVRNKAGESVLHKLATQLPAKDYLGYRYGGADSDDEDLKKTFKWLVEKGVDVSWEDEANRTCLDVAAATGAQWVLDMYKRK